MRKSDELDRIDADVREMLETTRTMAIRDDAPAAVVLAPVEVGVSHFVDVSSLPRLEDLPFIPERMRHFAFRYATEYKPERYWKKEFGVSADTIRKWLRNSGVRTYIALTRFEQRMFNLAQHVIMQRNVYKTINAILTTPINVDTIATVASMAKFVYTVLTNPSAASDRAKGTLNVNIGYGSTPPADPANPYQSERTVTPKQLAALEADIEELDIIAKALGKNGDEDKEKVDE